MSSHTPFIVVPQGAFAGAYLYKLRDDEEDPIYNKYAEGTLRNMTELANGLNYREAERNNELAVAVPTEEIREQVGGVGIPTEIPAEVRLEAISVALHRADAGKINLVQFKRRVQAAVHSEDLIG